MSGKVHSKLGASSCDRWSNCPGSVALLATLPEEKSGAAALEGTGLHDWAEMCLSDGARDATEFDGLTIDARVDRVRMTKELAAVVNAYLDCVYAQADKPGAVLYVEKRFHLTEIDDELYGTNDASVYVPSERTLYVFDLKTGRMPVEPTTRQLPFYAYGAWVNHRADGVDKIVCTIVQPRAHGEAIKSIELDELELTDWSFDLLDWVKATRAPNAPLVPGSWCSKSFCNARNGKCPALIAAADSALADGFAAAPETLQASNMTSAELGKRLAQVPTLEAYIKGLENLANAEASRGYMPAGFKWVLGKGRREWVPDKSQDEIAKEIARTSNAVNPWERSLISPAEAEKALGKKIFAALEKELVRKREGKPALAPTSDKRPAWQGDTAGFSAIEDTESND